jgi:hypothetical protein
MMAATSHEDEPRLPPTTALRAFGEVRGIGDKKLVEMDGHSPTRLCTTLRPALPSCRIST